MQWQAILYGTESGDSTWKPTLRARFQKEGWQVQQADSTESGHITASRRSQWSSAAPHDVHGKAVCALGDFEEWPTPRRRRSFYTKVKDAHQPPDPFNLKSYSRASWQDRDAGNPQRKNMGSAQNRCGAEGFGDLAGEPKETQGSDSTVQRTWYSGAAGRRRGLRAVEVEIAEEGTSSSTTSCSMLRNKNVTVASGSMLNLQEISFITDRDLKSILTWAMASTEFRWFAGRSVLDFKVEGKPTLELPDGYANLCRLATVLTALAERSLHEGECLAIIQLLLNRFQDGGDDVKPHWHRCRQICLSIGADRGLSVGKEGEIQVMRNGDCMPLDQEWHAVPAVQSVGKPRLSVCLFYGSTAEYANKAISVNANDGWHGNSFWWNHPEDFPRKGRGKSRRH